MTPYIKSDGDQQPAVNTLELFCIPLVHYLVYFIVYFTKFMYK